MSNSGSVSMGDIQHWQDMQRKKNEVSEADERYKAEQAKKKHRGPVFNDQAQ